MVCSVVRASALTSRANAIDASATSATATCRPVRWITREPDPAAAPMGTVAVVALLVRLEQGHRLRCRCRALEWLVRREAVDHGLDLRCLPPRQRLL